MASSFMSMPNKYAITPSAGMVMFNIFSDIECVTVTDFPQKGPMTKSVTYCK
jgi:hypothetical protein